MQKCSFDQMRDRKNANVFYYYAINEKFCIRFLQKFCANRCKKFAILQNFKKFAKNVKKQKFTKNNFKTSKSNWNKNVKNVFQLLKHPKHFLIKKIANLRFV